MSEPSEETRISDVVLERITRLLLAAFALIPLGASRAIGRLVGRLILLTGAKAARTTRRNLEICFPDRSPEERESIARQSVIHTGQTLMETPSIWLGDLGELSALIKDVENEELFLELASGEHGCIALLPHLGNWELFNVYLSSRNIKSTVLYKTPRQRWLRGIMGEIRQRYGNELVPTDVRGISRLFKALKAKGVVTVLPDQVPVTGEFVPFFGEPALTDRLVNRLLQKSAARAVCVTVPRFEDGFKVKFTPVDELLYESDAEVSLRALNSSVESCVLKDIDQYQWEYKRFRARPPGLAQVYSKK